MVQPEQRYNMKLCIDCHKSYETSHSSYCKPCHNERNRLNNLKDKYRNRRIRYNLSNAEFLVMLNNQEELCKICKIYMDNPQVDHDHSTGKVRGLLCGKCNRGLGLFNDNISSLLAAAEYLLTGQGESTAAEKKEDKCPSSP